MQNTMNKPAISILMSVYTESEEDIKISVDSLLNQTFTDFELILVNDNPEDPGTAKILGKIAAHDSRIKIITNDRNRGLGYALNNAVKSAQADIVARMDTEDTSLPLRLEKQVAYMSNNPDVDLLFTQWFDVNEKNEETPRLPSRKDVLNLKKTFFTKSLLMHPTLMARKAVLLKNSYPEMYRPEDIVLWLKLLRTGYVFDLLEEPLYRYKANRFDIRARYEKTKKGSSNILPHLVRESKYYWLNIYFWLYFFRTIGEYLVSRSFFVFKVIYTPAIRIWKSIFGK